MSPTEIKQARNRLKMTQQDLANALGVSLKTVSNYEQGMPIPIAKIPLLKKVLNARVNDRKLEDIVEDIARGAVREELDSLHEAIMRVQREVIVTREEMQGKLRKQGS